MRPLASLQEEYEAKYYEEADMKAIRMVFTENGKIRPKHARVLAVMERFARVKATSFGFNSIEHAKILGRMEMYNMILRYCEVTQDERRELREEVRRLKGDIENARRDSSD